MSDNVKSVAGCRLPVAGCHNFDYVAVAGYYYSGSSAVVDILQEFPSCFVPEFEFCAITGDDGIENLFTSVLTKEDCTIAIRNFMKFMKFLDHPYSILTPGHDYRRKLRGNFMRTTQEFISSLASFQYGIKAYRAMGGIEFFFKRICNIILRLLHADIYMGIEAHFIDISEADLIAAIKKYIDDIFSPIISTDTKHVILDQGIAAVNYSSQMSFLRKAKLIVVDRDARDNYADLARHGGSVTRSFSSPFVLRSRNVNHYIQYHIKERRNQKQIKNDPDVLFLQFEDLICHYDESLKRIIDFVGLDPADHLYKRKYFNPDVSIKNVGLWKDYLSDSEVTAITSELSEYFYTR